MKENEIILQQEDVADQSASINDKEDYTFKTQFIIKFYHKKLYENEKALTYLEKIGLKNKSNYGRFKLGYPEESIIDVLSEKEKEELTKLNLFEGGNEYFNNCIVFPVYDEFEKLVSIYGLDITSNSFLKPVHFYSNVPIFNIKSTKVYDEIIFTDNILDCLSLIELGFENVISINDFTLLNEDHIKSLKDNRVKTVILSGNLNNNLLNKFKELFLLNDFEMKILNIPDNYTSWNNALQKNIEKDEILKLINNSERIKLNNRNDLFKVLKSDYKYTFKFSEITYIITGVKDIFVSNLRVNIKAEYEGEIFPDSLDLYSARSRSSYCSILSNKFGIESQIIERDLIKILEYLEYERDKKLNEDEEKEIELTEDEKELGLKFLRHKNLFTLIVNDMTTLGYIGEDLNKKLLYICASSRKLDNPISVLLISQSASGKSYLVETVRKLIPHEDVISITSLSDQALNYLTDMSHKFLIFGEAIHSDTIEYQIREMLSSKELTRLVTLKDDKTGKLKSELIKKKVIVSTVMSTTTHKINPENASRYFIVNADESKIQTQKIHESQKLKYTLERQYIKDVVIPMIIKKHHIAQKLLKDITIINNFAKYLNFPDSTMRTRRDHERFIDLITAVCFLRQYQKEIKSYEFDDKNNEEKRIIEYIECDLEDYKIAYEIMINGIILATMTEIPKRAISLYEEIRKMVKEQAVERQLFPEEIIFIQRELREYSKFNADSIKKYLKILVDFEYIVVSSGRNRGTRYSYKLRKDEPIESIDISVIPSPEDMEKVNNKEESKPVLKNTI